MDGSFSPGIANQNSEIEIMKSKAHSGFKKVAQGISRRQGIPIAHANAILASATRKAKGLAKNAKIPKRK